MSRWNSLFVSEMNHEYRRFLETKDVENFIRVLKEALSSDNEFKVAYTNGFIEWLKESGVSLDIEVKSCVVLNPPVYPPLCMEPTFVKYLKEYINNSLPEFRKYGVIIQKVGDSA